jgi:hypothetical protein
MGALSRPHVSHVTYIRSENRHNKIQRGKASRAAPLLGADSFVALSQFDRRSNVVRWSAGALARGGCPTQRAVRCVG